MRKDQQPCLADTEPMQFKVALSALSLALTRADAPPVSIFTQTVFHPSQISQTLMLTYIYDFSERMKYLTGEAIDGVLCEIVQYVSWCVTSTNACEIVSA